MYNLNMSGSGVNNLLNIPQGEASSTPRTPEIVNSLIAMQNPLDCFRNTTAPRLASSPPGGSDTTSSSSGSPSCVSPPSVQHTCSQLIKEGLKLTIQTKRRQTERNCTINDDDRNKVARRDEVSRDSLGDDDDDDLFSTGDGLTPEDEERRKRRRERNKIAATKCRLKKREKTVNLVQESEILENQNHDLKSQIQELETQKRQLVDMLSVHRPSCTKQQYNSLETTSSFPSQNFHRLDNTYPRPTSAVTMENTSSSMYRRVNISTYSSRPSSTSTVDSTLAYRRMEMAHSYERPASTAAIEPTYQRLEATVEENTSYCRPSGTSSLLHDSTIATYHNFDEDVIKDPSIMLVPYCKSSSIENPTSFLRMTSDQYTCQQNLINLDNSLDYIKPETSPVYQRPPSTFGRPISVDINTPVSPGYDSHPEGLDSPSIAPNTYQHFEDSTETTFTAGFTTSGINRGCIA